MSSWADVVSHDGGGTTWTRDAAERAASAAPDTTGSAGEDAAPHDGAIPGVQRSGADGAGGEHAATGTAGRVER